MEAPFLQSDVNGNLFSREFQGYSEKLGGFVKKNGPFTASIDFKNAVLNGTNKQLYQQVLMLYNYYSLQNSNYNINYNGSPATNIRVITIPAVYYDTEVLSGSFTASDYVGGGRTLYDDGKGGIYSGSLSGTLVGNIFYSEGIVVLKKPDLITSFAEPSSQPGNPKLLISFRGTHKIPVKIFKCRAPSRRAKLLNQSHILCTWK